MIGERVCWFQLHLNSSTDYGYTVFYGTCVGESPLEDGYICEPDNGKVTRWVPKADVKIDPKELKQAALDRLEWLRREYNAGLDNLFDSISQW
jgi:hypothetical protein